MNDVRNSSKLDYGRKLVNAGISGVRAGHKEFDPEKASTLVTSSAEEAVKIALAGVCLGVVLAALLARRSRATNAIVFGVAGGLLGFLASFSWKTRSLTSTLAHSAFHEVRKAQDEHWLEGHPIDYA
jgi:hypothetical protein